MNLRSFIHDAIFPHEEVPAEPCGFAQVRSYVRRAKPEAYVKTHDRLRSEVERGGEGVG